MKYFDYSQQSFVYKYVVMLSDVDQFKHMSFANYLKLMFLATDALFVSSVTDDFLSANRIKLKESKMQFKRQTVAGDNLLVKVNSTGTNGSQFSLLFTFIIEGSNELVAIGRQTYEIIDVNGQSRITVPENIRNILGPIHIDEIQMNKAKVSEISINSNHHKTFTFDKISVFFKHTDYHGFAHPYNFLEWMSYTREAYFQQLVVNFLDLCNRDIKMVTTDVNFKLLNDCIFGDQIEVKIYSENVKRLSFEVVFHFYRQLDMQLLGRGRQRLTFLEAQSGKPARIPEELKKVVLEFEKK